MFQAIFAIGACACVGWGLGKKATIEMVEDGFGALVTDAAVPVAGIVAVMRALVGCVVGVEYDLIGIRAMR